MLGALVLLVNATGASGNDPLPDPFSGDGWLVEGMREVASQDVEFAPMTTCYDLNEKFAGNSTTSIQKKREWGNYKGKYIPLTGTLEEVKEVPLSDDYLAYFKCTNSDSLIVDFTMKIPGELEDYAFSLSPGDKHEVFVKLTRYGEITGVMTEIDVINIDMGNGDSCPAQFTYLSREDGIYQYTCGEVDVGFHRYLNKKGHAFFSGWSKQEEDQVGILMPTAGKKDYILSREGGDLLYYGGHGDACYLRKDFMESTPGIEDVIKGAYAEIELGLEEKDLLPAPENIPTINAAISALDADKYSCKVRQALRIALIISGDFDT